MVKDTRYEKAFQKFRQEIIDNKDEMMSDDEYIDQGAYEILKEDTIDNLAYVSFCKDYDYLEDKAIEYVWDECFEDILDEEAIRKAFDEMYENGEIDYYDDDCEDDYDEEDYK